MWKGIFMFFELLKRACFDKRISVSRLLQDLGLSKSSVTYWRNGSKPTIDKVIKISERLDIPIEYLLEGEMSGGSYCSASVQKLSAAGRVGEARRAPYGSTGNEKSSVTEHELGRLMGRIEELERKNAEYKEIIENGDNQLCETIEKIAEQLKKISKRSN